VNACLLLEDLAQSCVRGERGKVKDTCYGIRLATACVDESDRDHLTLVNAGARARDSDEPASEEALL